MTPDLWERMTMGQALEIVLLYFGQACAFAVCVAVAALAFWLLLRDGQRPASSDQQPELWRPPR